jgi:hypothetical protein
MLDLSKYDRVFTFGCSFTNYDWPTWADIIIHDFSNKGYNYGLSGLGNVGIMHRILEADLRHKFTEKDCILICWTSWVREDRFLFGSWKRYGCVYINPFYTRKFWKYCDQDNDLMKNATAIIMTNKTYHDKIIFQGGIADYQNPEIDYGPKSNIYKDLEKFYIKELNIPEGNLWSRYKMFEIYSNNDGHPTVKSHLTFVNDIIGYQVKPSTKEYFINLHDQFSTLISKHPKDFMNKMENVIDWKRKMIGFD